MKSGFVVILGRPNVGKSTLLNALVGSKLAIVTHQPQTTRDAIQGVVTRAEGQVIFVDSPGIHEPSLELGRRMMREIQRATAGCHLVLLLVDAAAPARRGDRIAADLVKRLEMPALLLLNKIDLLKSKQVLLKQIDDYRCWHAFEEFVPISAQQGDNLELVLKLIYKRLPEAPPYYPEDYLTDQPERFLAAELIREQIILQTHQEVPHSTAVLIDRWSERSGLLHLSATIYVEREGQKGILIGTQGQKLKQIGARARQQLEARFGRRVFVELFVKVQPRWRDQPRFVRSLEFRRMVGHEGPGEERVPAGSAPLS